METCSGRVCFQGKRHRLSATWVARRREAAFKALEFLGACYGRDVNSISLSAHSLNSHVFHTRALLIQRWRPLRRDELTLANCLSSPLELSPEVDMKKKKGASVANGTLQCSPLPPQSCRTTQTPNEPLSSSCSHSRNPHRCVCVCDSCLLCFFICF